MSTNESVFDRLYRQSTAASRAASIHSSVDSAPAVSSKSSSLNRAPHRQTQRVETSEKNVNAHVGSKDKNTPKHFPVAVVPARYTGSWRITTTSKYASYPNKTVTRLNPVSLKLTTELRNFDQGEIDARRFACYLIDALFDRDHMKGKHWDYDPPSASPITSDDESILRFQAEKEATWDWKDIYSVATAKGTIVFFMETNEIRVEDYSYYAAG